jgi:5-oxopent-3-ene-1,2,5-tricarboxylate decarboxylase / 2-hydroxyhepta-2,4-diene-1,7-dioate isomerase
MTRAAFTSSPVQTLRTVYGSLMHHRLEHQAMEAAALAPPYLKLPQAPVLYIKPANTFSAYDAQVALPQGVLHVQARACIGAVLMSNRPLALIKSAPNAINLISTNDLSWQLFCDLSLPQASWHRPPVKFNALDGSLGVSQAGLFVSAQNVDALEIETWVNGQCVHRYSTSDWLTTALEQLQTVNTFVSFEAGDALMMGCPPQAPSVGVGDTVEVRCAGQIFTRLQITEHAS